MATPIFCCGFECGQITPNGSGSIGEHWAISGTSAMTFDTTIKRSGNRSLKFVNMTSTSFVSPIVAVHATINVARFYVYFATLPNVNVRLYLIGNATDTIGTAFFQVSDSKIYAGQAAGFLGATGVPVIAERWYCIDVRVTCNANPWTNDVMVDGIACGQFTSAVAATTATFQRFYSPSAAGSTTTSYIDDVAISNTSADYPLGPGTIRPHTPTSDGTHSGLTAGDYQRTLTGTDILLATTTAFQLIDDVPLESGASVDWINMVAPAAAADYVECIFGPASGMPVATQAPKWVEVILGIHQAGTGTGNMQIRLNDNGTTDVVYTATTVAGTTSVIYKRKHYATAPTGGAWTVISGAGNFNNLRVRYGCPAAIDANPDQYFDCIMIEAEFPEPKQKVVQVKQAVNRASTY